MSITFSELNTNKSTITLAEQMGYDLNEVKSWLKDDPTNEYTLELLTPEQYLDEKEIAAAVKSGKLNYWQADNIMSNWGDFISQTNWAENAEEILSYVPETQPASGVGSANAFEEVITDDRSLSGYGSPLFSADFGQTKTLETPEVTVVSDNTDDQVRKYTITVNDPSKVRIGFYKSTCTGLYEAAIDTNNDGTAEIGLDTGNLADVSNVWVIINGQQTNLGDFLYQHQANYQTMANSMGWDWEGMKSGGWLG